MNDTNAQTTTPASLGETLEEKAQRHGDRVFTWSNLADRAEDNGKTITATEYRKIATVEQVKLDETRLAIEALKAPPAANSELERATDLRASLIADLAMREYWFMFLGDVANAHLEDVDLTVFFPLFRRASNVDMDDGVVTLMNGDEWDITGGIPHKID